MTNINPTLALFNLTGISNVPQAGVVDAAAFSKLLADLNNQLITQVPNQELPINSSSINTLQTKTNEFVNQQINVEDLIHYLKTAESVDDQTDLKLKTIEPKAVINYLVTEENTDKKSAIPSSTQEFAQEEDFTGLVGVANFQTIPSAADNIVRNITDVSTQVQKIYQPDEIPKLNWNKNQNGQVDGANISFKHGQSELSINIRIDLKTNEISMSLPSSTQLPIEQLKSIQNEFRDHINQSGLQVSWIAEKHKTETVVKTNNEQSFSGQNYNNESQHQEQKKKNKHR